MAYQEWSVVYGEVPTASKWNILGTNDASFKDGTGIDDDAILMSKLNNPYRMRAYSDGLTNVATGTYTKVPLQNVVFDPNNNLDEVTTFEYTVPVDGFYQINAAVRWTGVTAAKEYWCLVGNGTVSSSTQILLVGMAQSSLVGNLTANINGQLYLTAGQKITLYCYHAAGVNTPDVSGTAYATYLDIHLVGV